MEVDHIPVSLQGMKTASAAAGAVVLAGSLLTALPAHADITYSGCDNETYTKSVKFKKKFAYSIAQPAIACAEHYSGPGGACQMLTSYDSRSSFGDIKMGRHVRSATAWGAVSFHEEPKMVSCESATTARGTPYATVQYKGAFMWEHKGKMYIARPGLQAIFNGYTTTDDVILSFKRTGNWDFKRFKPKS